MSAPQSRRGWSRNLCPNAFRLDNSRYPTSEQGIAALVTRPSSGPAPTNWKSYLDKVPNDPWGKPYQYLNPGIRGEIDVFSLGADGQTGGARPAAERTHS